MCFTGSQLYQIVFWNDSPVNNCDPFWALRAQSSIVQVKQVTHDWYSINMLLFSLWQVKPKAGLFFSLHFIYLTSTKNIVFSAVFTAEFLKASGFI